MSKHRAGATRSRTGGSAPAPRPAAAPFPGGAPNSDLSFFQLSEKYPDEQSAIAYFTKHRWPDGPSCPDCGVVGNSYDCKANRRLPLLKCKDCGHQFTVISGTVMENTKLPLRKWLWAYHMLGGAKKSLSSRFLARQLGITLKSAWHLSHRIRATMAQNSQVFTGIVETDELYVGGRRKHVGKGYRKNKIAVQTIVQRRKKYRYGEGGKFTPEQSGQAQTIALDPLADRVDGRTVGAKLRTHTIPEKTVLMTDESPIYTQVGKGFKEHHTVNHKREDYAHYDDDGHHVHTNTAEGLFANLERQLHGTHHSTSKKHLPRYLEEFDYKYNTRDQNDTERTESAIGKMEGRRVTLFKSESGEGDSLHDRKASEPSTAKTQRGASQHKRTGRSKAAPAAVNVDAQVEAARAVLAKHGEPRERAAVAAAGGEPEKAKGKRGERR